MVKLLFGPGLTGGILWWLRRLRRGSGPVDWRAFYYLGGHQDDVVLKTRPRRKFFVDAPRSTALDYDIPLSADIDAADPAAPFVRIPAQGFGWISARCGPLF